MWRLSWLLTVLVAVSAASATAATAFRIPTVAQVRPQAFGSCQGLVSYARSHFAVTHGLPEPPITPVFTTTAVGKPATAAAPGAASASDRAAGGSTPSFSTTNNQEQGVDEPDTVKTDGKTIFTVAGNKLYAVDVNGGSPRLAGSLDLGTTGYGSQLLLRDNRVIVISGQAVYAVGGGAPIPLGVANRAAIMSSPYYSYGPQTTFSEVNVSDPSQMKVTQTMTVEGRFVDARQNGGSARFVISSAPQAVPDRALRLVESGWVPTRQFNDLRTGRHFVRDVASCRSIRRPVQFSGLGMLTIITMNFDKGLGMAHSDALMADAQVVYGSQSSLYLATQQWDNPIAKASALPASQSTVIDQFDVSDPNSTTLVASGEVPGYLLNQFSLSEYNGYLRAATTSRPIWWGDTATPSQSQSFVTVLKAQNGLLTPVGQVSGLGQGEQIYSVRFADDAAYVVTFHQVDPLYTIDLSTPSAPRVAGELALEGYSAYLHPLGDGLLLGVGVSVDAGINEPSGAQLELFDVSDLASPKLVEKVALGQGSSSTVQYEHHAFLYWPATGLVVLPLQIYGCSTIVTPNQRSAVCPSSSFQGAMGFHVAKSGLSEVGQVVHDSVNGSPPAIDRSLVIGDQLYTTSSAGVMASSLAALSRQSFVAFPV